MAKFDISKWIPLGFKLIQAIPGVVAAVERAKDGFKSGANKEDAAVALAKTSVYTIEDLADKDLLNDPAVEQGVRDAMKAVVALQNIIANAKNLRTPSTPKPAPVE